MSRQLESSGHEHCRPDDRVKARDVLTHDVQVGGPSLRIVFGRISSRGEIVGQRIEPDIRRLGLTGARRPGEGDSPCKPRAACRDVVETLVEKREHLVPAAAGTQKVAARDQIPQPFSISAQAEEPVLLGNPLKSSCGMDDALALDDLVVLLERFAANAVPALVFLLVEIAGRILEYRLDERAYAGMVILGGRSHELVVGD